MMISRRSISVSTDGDQPTPAKPASAHGGRGVRAAPEVVILEVPVRIRPAAPLLSRTLSIGELPAL
jgi:hypothetical protein